MKTLRTTSSTSSLSASSSTCIFFLVSLSLAIAIGTASSSSSKTLSPILSIPGDHSVFLLLDVLTWSGAGRRGGGEENEEDVGAGDVSNEVTSVIPLLLGAVNMVEKIHGEANISLGFTVYDTSGASAAVLRVMAGLLSEVETTPTAVILMTSQDVTHSMSSLLQSMGVYHVVISSDDVDSDVNAKPGQKVVMPLYDSSRAQATVTLLEALNITYTTPSASNDSLARRELIRFRHLVNEASEVCSLVSLTSKASPVRVVFTGSGGGHDGGGSGDVMNDGNADVIVVVGDRFEGVGNSSGKTVLWLHDSVDEVEMEEMLEMNFTESSASVSPPLNATLCTSFRVSITGNTSTADDSCLLQTRTVRALQALSDALAYVAAATLKVTNSTQNISRNHSSDDLRSPLEQFLDDPSKDVPERRKLYEVLVYEDGKVGENSDSVLNMVDTVLIPEFLQKRVFNRACDVDCHLCDVCVPVMKSGKRIMTSFNMMNSSLLVVGLFSVSQSREGKEGVGCDLENPEGVEAARLFLSALESYTDRYRGSFPNLTVGGAVLDACGDKAKARDIQQEVEACHVTFQDAAGAEISVQPSRVIAYFDFKNYEEYPDFGKAVMKVTDDEFRVTTNSHVTYLQIISDVLLAVRWSYLHVVVSEGYIYRAQVKHILKSKGVCVADEIITKEEDLTLASFKIASSSSSAILFLTDHPTTLRLLQMVYSRNSSLKLKAVFLPWNTDVIDTLPRSFYMETAIVTEHVTPDSFQFPKSRARQDPWRGVLERVFTNRSSRLKGLSLVPMAVDSLMASLDTVYKQLCPEGRGVCRGMENFKNVKQMLMETGIMTDRHLSSAFLELDVFALRGRSKMKIGEVDAQSKVLMNAVSVQHIPPSECSSWCPQCLHCRSSPASSSSSGTASIDAYTTHTPSSTTSSASSVLANPHSARYPTLKPALTIPGDLLIAGVFPVHQAGGESFSCGGFVDSVDEKRAEQAFVFALSTAKRRYANLLPGINVGGVLLDSCSSLATGLHKLGQFESCRDNAVSDSREKEDSTFLNPVQVVGYVLQDSFSMATVLGDTVRGLHKMACITSPQGMKDGPTSSQSPEKVTVDAMLSLFSQFGWNYAYILTSEDEKFMDMAEYFVDEAGYRGICVVRYLQLLSGGSNARRVADTLASSASSSVPIILFLSRVDAVALFQDSKLGALTSSWVISMIGDDWLSTVGINIPWGALLIDVQGKINDDFQVFLEQFSTSSHSPISPWWRDYLQIRLGCLTSLADSSLSTPPAGNICTENPLLTGPMYPSAAASRVIRGVDSLLHALDARYKTRCPDRRGICGNLTRDIIGGRLSLADANFKYEEGIVNFDREGDMDVTVSIHSYQPGKLVMTGAYRSSGLSINTSLIHFYTPRGEIQPLPLSLCPSCTCINVVANVTQSPAPSTTAPPALAHWLWREEKGVFIREVWAWSVLAVSLGGASTTMCVIFYVMFKVWQGALARRYIGLGLLMLSAITCLYLSTLPFLFSPSPGVCGLRYLMPALALCLCLACVLVKLMALQDYRTIGLGGELSALNQGLSVFFILLVQISISVQWWVFRGSFLREARDEVKKFSCLFRPQDFALHLSFVTFLVLLCALYSVSVRREKKNMGEARLLLAGSWTTLFLWLAWISLLLLLREHNASLVACCGILAVASALLLVIFVPKVRMVSRLKYDLYKKQAVRNGYSVDTDFLYERPYSLPGTLTSTYSSIRTYPKSVTATNFDSSLSY